MIRLKTVLAGLAAASLVIGSLQAANTVPFNDTKPQLYRLSERASQIDPRAKEHPEIDFVFTSGGKVQDLSLIHI